jgi:acetyl esterase
MVKIHPDMQVLIDASNSAGPHGETVEEKRAYWYAYTRSLNRPAPDSIAIEDRVVQAALPVPVRVYRPPGLDGPRPCIIYMHGGGFMLGDLDSSDSIAWGFAEETGAVVVSIDYRLTPEHPYPAGIEDCRTVLLAVAQEPNAWGIDPSRIAIAGDSAGGNFVASLSLWARDRGGPDLACQVMVYPTTGLDQHQGSYLEYANGPGLTIRDEIKYRSCYLPQDRETSDPYARPVLAVSHADLPPAWVHSAGIDPIRDDGRVYAANLAASGTDVCYREARGMIHGFMRARFTGPDAAHEFALICRFLKAHFVG